MSVRLFPSLLAALTLAVGALTLSPAAAEAQFGRRLKDAVKRTAEDKAIQKATEKEGQAIDGAMSGGKDSTAAATAATGDTTAAPAAGGTAAAGVAADSAPATKKAWANYDFIPGQRTLFLTDFTDDVVGNFPQRLEFKTGAMEVVEFEGGQRALKASDQSEFLIPLPEVLPDKYTIELDVTSRAGRGSSASTIHLAGGRGGDHKFSAIEWGNGGFYLMGGPVQVNLDTKDRDRYLGKPASFRILGDGKYLKAYVDEKRVANIPNAEFARAKTLFVRLQGRDDDKDAVYLTRIRVAESQKTIYDALSAEGRWATQGILFDIGKADIKPESTPTLKQIATALKEHPELKVEIQGHTDNVGKADANLKLSQARADAVAKALTGEHGVGAGQLTAKGYGDSKPATDNKTAEGRANNRRVELVKS